jgi:exosome complex component RRP42
MSSVIPSIKKDFIYKLLSEGKRIDGRAFDEYRPIKIETGVISKAEGSARVKIGNTQVLAGVKMDVGEPYSDSPESGVLTTTAELIPLASPDFEAGPPGEEAIELARVVDRGIRESKILQLDKLCIEPGEKVWIVFIDIHVLDQDGNLFDASLLASLAALYTATVPAERFELGENFKLPLLKDPPISCTSVKLDNAIVIDPILDEEEIADARLTVATDKKGDIRAMQKGLSGGFSIEEVKKIIKASIHNGKKLREVLDKSIRGK